MIRSVKIAVLLAWIILLPTLAFAQASIAGVVRDTSGAVLPGVIVEAASPALIEKVRTVVTDGTGQYRLVDLQSGTYTVTFTLAGFNTFKRDGVELSGNFTATVNAELRVGVVEETVTVTGESPVVDVRNTLQQQTVDREVIAAIPTGRAFQQIATLMPAMQTPSGGGVSQGATQDVGGVRGPAATSDRYVVHGGVVTDSRVQVDGLGTGSLNLGGAAGSYYMPPVGNSQEVVITTSGNMGEAETGGVIVNVIPRDGGNSNRGTFFSTFGNHGMQSDNYTQALKDRGLKSPNRVAEVWEVTPSFGGPVLKDKLWYYASVRNTASNSYIAGMFFNKNAGNPNSWTYEADLSKPVILYTQAWSAALRMTWQASARNKFTTFWDEQPRRVDGVTATTSPEATSGYGWTKINRVSQMTWTSPLTNKVMLQAGFGQYLVHTGGFFEPPGVSLIRVTEQGGAIPGLSYRGSGSLNGQGHEDPYRWRASITYVTGAQDLKVGYQGSLLVQRAFTYVPNGEDVYGLSFRFNNGVPNQLTQGMGPRSQVTHMKVSALYAQDRWTTHRLTLQGGVRYDHFGSYFPDQQLGPNNFLTTAFAFPGHGGVNFNDITPRMGAAYDLFGNGRTAVKVHLGKYMTAQETSSPGNYGSFLNPVGRMTTSTSRSWNDANRNVVPDCDLVNPSANGECGALANQNFGKNVFSVNYDPKATNGWGVRPYSWEFALSLQQQLLPGVAANVGYYRRWFGNFPVVDNRAVSAADYTLFNLPVPVDPRLPRSGSAVAIADINPAKFGAVDNLMTNSNNYGRQIQHWNGFDAAVDVRPQNTRVFLQGGVSVGRTFTDNCEVVAKVPEARLATVWMPLEYCRLQSPFLAQVKGFGGFTLPRIDVLVSGTFQNVPGPELQANWNAPNAVVAPVLGRSLSGGAANIPLNLLAPLSTYGDRLTQIDFRIAKILKLGRTSTQLSFDLYNALNSSAVQTQNNTYGPAWLTPTLVHTARLAKVSAQIDF